MDFMRKDNNVSGNVIFLSGCFSRQNSAGEGEAEIYSVNRGIGTYTDTELRDILIQELSACSSFIFVSGEV